VDESKMAPAATSYSEEFLGVMGTPAANVLRVRVRVRVKFSSWA